MKIVLQRIKESNVVVEQEVIGSVNQGYMALVGITHDDNKDIIEKMIDKVIHLRVFEDENGKMNLSLLDIKGSILSISQFTLYADCRKGRRPGFTNAAKPDQANALYEYFNQKLREKGIIVETGIFGADMKVSLINDGPVTIILDSKEILKK